MFKVAKTKTVRWPVTVKVPQDGGRTQDAEFTAEFDVIPQQTMDAVVLAAGDLLDRVLIGWEGVADESGQATPYSSEAKKDLLDITYVRHALFGAYSEVQQGRAAARKN